MTNPIMPVYERLDVVFQSGEGAWLVDENGKRYLDALAGVGVVALGHSNPAVTETINQQAGSLLHTSNLYRVAAQENLAAKLTRLAGMDNAFFANSGAEANECAIKIARLYGRQKGIQNPTIIVTNAAFHGRTLATLIASGSRKVQAGFEPLLNGFVRAPFNDLEAIRNMARNNNNIVAVMVEPIQGEGGIIIAKDNYLKEMRNICDQQDWLMLLDEVQTGNGRTGTYFNYQQSNITPDLLTTAKGLANGIPIGVCLARGAAAKVFTPGNHGSTFGGNPLACAVASTVIDYIQDNNLAERAGKVGERMLHGFKTRLGTRNNVKDIRGKGLMLGIELNAPCGDLVTKALDKGLLINVITDKVIRLLPPLIISDAEADKIVDLVCQLIEEN